jgi:hypothetical protein
MAYSTTVPSAVYVVRCSSTTGSPAGSISGLISSGHDPDGRPGLGGFTPCRNVRDPGPAAAVPDASRPGPAVKRPGRITALTCGDPSIIRVAPGSAHPPNRHRSIRPVVLTHDRSGTPPHPARRCGMSFPTRRC